MSSGSQGLAVCTARLRRTCGGLWLAYGLHLYGGMVLIANPLVVLVLALRALALALRALALDSEAAPAPSGAMNREPADPELK